MFQEMQSGDSIIITAKVVACVEEKDFRIQCSEEVEGNNVSWRRAVELRGKTESWEENMKLKFRMHLILQMDFKMAILHIRPLSLLIPGYSAG